MEIQENYQDEAGKWRVLVKISDMESHLFKFQCEPTTEEITTEVENYVAANTPAE